jgi:hypothetical protein
MYYRGVLPAAQRQPLEHKQKCGEMSLTARVIKIDTVSVVYVVLTGVRRRKAGERKEKTRKTQSSPAPSHRPTHIF